MQVSGFAALPRHSPATGAVETPPPEPTRTIIMKLLTDLFSTDYGLMSISGIVFMLGMGVFFLRFFARKMEEDGKAANAAKATGR
jgi:hypothetical protein